MGAQFASAHSAPNMKLLVVLALAAIVAAEPEAEAKTDPYLLYGGYGLGHYGYGLGYHGLGYGGYYYGKREAEAEPKAEAEPYLYGYGYGLGHLGYGYHGWATGPTSTERGRPRLSPRLLLIPTCCTEATTAMDLATTAATTAMDWPTTERGRLRPSPRLLLIPTCCTVATDSATGPTATPTSTDITMARGRLRLRLIPTTMWLLRPWTRIRLRLRSWLQGLL